MRWYTYVAYFLGGAFLINVVPHFVNGVSGRPFPSPFASPPGQGLSSPLVNVWWGAFNFLVAYLLLCRVGKLEMRRVQHVLPVALGGLLIAIMSALAFGRVFGGA